MAKPPERTADNLQELGWLRRSETIPWRVIAAEIAPPERRGLR
jgi:hypothetical protein